MLNVNVAAYKSFDENISKYNIELAFSHLKSLKEL